MKSEERREEERKHVVRIDGEEIYSEPVFSQEAQDAVRQVVSPAATDPMGDYVPIQADNQGRMFTVEGPEILKKLQDVEEQLVYLQGVLQGLRIALVQDNDQDNDQGKE